ncbi:MAG: MoxR family ATPase [Tissierellia bacterium]|nr:MoxR family ATPase [Tissierellia bacterium]
MDKFFDQHEIFLKNNQLDDDLKERIPVPRFQFIGDEIWDKAVAAMLSGKNLLLVGEKSTGKNVLAENLAAYFKRPIWDISFNINIDSTSLIGAETLKNKEVVFQPGPIYQCAKYGGFGVLDEINMAKNEAMAVLHSSLDFRRTIDVPGYDRISLHPATRFIATMNYGYAGTRELNEALLSRFVVIEMPQLDKSQLKLLFKREYDNLKDKYIDQFAELFIELRRKVNSGEVSNSSLDIRGMIDAIKLMDIGLNIGQALEMTLIDKTFDEYEKILLKDVIKSRFDMKVDKKELFK